MRIAILSDIHSNLQALTKALEVVDELGVEEIYCLGDIVGYGANPNECIELLCDREAHCVLGNHDEAVVRTDRLPFVDADGAMVIQWTREIITRENAEYLLGLPLVRRTDCATLVHSNPAKPESWGRILTLQDAEAQFPGFTSSICFIGHTHTPFVCGEDLQTFEVTEGIRFLINVGSVGQPRDGNPQLSCGLLDTESWTYENIRTDYDVAAAGRAIVERGLPPSLAERLTRGL